MKRAILGVLVLVVVGLASPARADSASGSIAGIDGVLYDDCVPHPYGYQVTVPADAGYWDLTSVVTGPNGRTTSDYVAMPGPSGTSSFAGLCQPADAYGTYTITASVRWGHDGQTLGTPVQLADSHFTLRKPFTRTSLSVSTRRPAYGQVVTYRILTMDERPSGYFATSFAWVFLQKRVAGQWVRIKGSRTLTHSDGRVKLRLRYLHHRKRMWIRAVTATSARRSTSVSPAVRIW